MSARLLLAAPDAANAALVADGYVLGVGRTVPATAAVLALIGVVVGGLALSRSVRRADAGRGRSAAVVALALGLVSVIVGGLHAANSAGGLGTGNGLAGAVIAVALGLTGLVLGGLVLVRSRRAAVVSGHGRGRA